MFSDIVWYLDVFGMFAVCVCFWKNVQVSPCAWLSLRLWLQTVQETECCLFFRRYLIVKDAYFITPLESRKKLVSEGSLVALRLEGSFNLTILHHISSGGKQWSSQLCSSFYSCSKEWHQKGMTSHMVLPLVVARFLLNFRLLGVVVKGKLYLGNRKSWVNNGNRLFACCMPSWLLFWPSLVYAIYLAISSTPKGDLAPLEKGESQ